MSAHSRLVAIVVAFALTISVENLPAADWPMLGRDVTRNPVSHEKNPPTEWNVKTGKNIKWQAKLGSMTHGTPVVADGQVYFGTNNGAAYIARYPWNDRVQVDLEVLLCFRETDGKFLWQFSAEKLPQGRVHDWPLPQDYPHGVLVVVVSGHLETKEGSFEASHRSETIDGNQDAWHGESAGS